MSSAPKFTYQKIQTPIEVEHPGLILFLASTGQGKTYLLSKMIKDLYKDFLIIYCSVSGYSLESQEKHMIDLRSQRDILFIQGDSMKSILAVTTEIIQRMDSPNLKTCLIFDNYSHILNENLLQIATISRKNNITLCLLLHDLVLKGSVMPRLRPMFTNIYIGYLGAGMRSVNLLLDPESNSLYRDFVKDHSYRFLQINPQRGLLSISQDFPKNIVVNQDAYSATEQKDKSKSGGELEETSWKEIEQRLFAPKTSTPAQRSSALKDDVKVMIKKYKM